MKVPKARKLPSGTWFIQLRLGGESISVTASTEKECTKKAQYTKAEYLAGRREKRGELQKLPTLREACHAYIDSRILSPSTELGYLKVVKNRFRSLMDRSLSDITDSEYQAAAKAESQLCSAKTLKNAWFFVATVLRSNRITPPEISLPQVVPHETPFLDSEQIQTFRQAIRGNKYEIPMLLALHSLRRSEILALQWENIDLAKRCIYIRGAAVVDKNNQLVYKKENKNESSNRTVPILIPELYDLLSANQQQPSGSVVTCGADTIRRNVNAVCLENQLPLVGTHGLRHSFASLAYHLNVPEKITMEIGGWNDDQTMKKIYTHIARSDMQRYTEQFSAFFDSASPTANDSPAE